MVQSEALARKLNDWSDYSPGSFWDHQPVFMQMVVEKIDMPAWDVYLLFGRDAEWKEQPPAPVFWMDQLGLENGKQFDADRLAAQIRVSLNSNQGP